MPIEPDDPDLYFTVSELRNLPDLQDAAAYNDAALENCRNWIIGVVERWCHTSFIPRMVTEIVTRDQLNPDRSLVLKQNWTLPPVATVTVAGAEFDENGLALVQVTRSGVVNRYADDTFAQPVDWGGWPIVIEYLAGYSAEPPLDLKQEMLTAARVRVLSNYGSSGIPDRALSLQTPDGNIVMAQPGMKRPVGIPSVDECIIGWAQRTRIPA